MAEAAEPGQELTQGADPAPASASSAPRQWWQTIGVPAGPQLGVIAAIAVALALVVVGILWLDRETYRVVYQGLADRDAAAVVSALEAASIPVRIDNATGNIEVPATRVHEARFKLAGQGLPRGGGFGFEFLQDNGTIGSSQFMDTARYRHALENELARSIASIGIVQSARVHLAMQAKSAFVRDQAPPTASVVLKLHPGRTLDGGQVAAITHMVATGVPGMLADRISIVDQLGRLLSKRNESPASGLNMEQLEYARRLESDYVQRVEQILAPLVGVDGLRAEASADVDFAVIERTEERFDSDNPAVRSEQVVRTDTPLPDPAEGVPGALT
ncbi:MAG: flagellar M-ring protein FliF, partial [Chromatiales bacterium]|nr:flagellar M-ring protein FliF [Chromatiales bacterium]